VLLPLLFTAPWLGVLAFVVFRVRLPQELPQRGPEVAPFVSVVVPARNEAVNIRTCLHSLTASTYPAFEIIVVDDRSEDGTADLARRVSAGKASRVEIVDGAELPEAWLGKPWACWQGARVARGELILFTDADTTHGPDLLGSAVAALQEDRADLLTVVGRQLMGTFWERLVQPQIFLTMVLRFYDVDRSLGKGRWRDAIANGQFMLFRRDSHDALGGHRAVRDEVVEDLALAQLVVRRGMRLVVRRSETSFATRMYRSLGELIEGWSKNLTTGALQTMPRRIRPFVAPLSAVVGVCLWILPPLLLAVTLTGAGGPSLRIWATATVGVSAAFWMLFTARMGAPFVYGALYPLGSGVGLYILLRSWIRGRTVAWKGRTYLLKDVAEAP
jgi:chlorobactene glucosyltransferase